MTDENNEEDDSSSGNLFGVPVDTLNSVYDALDKSDPPIDLTEVNFDPLVDLTEIPPLPDPYANLTSEQLDAAIEAVEHVEQTTNFIETTLDIEPPWNYTPVPVDDDDLAEALQWLVEARIRMSRTNNQYFEKIARRILKGRGILAEEVTNDVREELYGPAYIFASSQDSLLHWLCENDPNIHKDYENSNNEPVYGFSTKNEALEKWYDQHSVADIESGKSLSDKWEGYVEHRHRIMHGHPDAYYDLNTVVAAIWFFVLTVHVAMDRHEQIV